jgi:prevent-host-death family protein
MTSRVWTVTEAKAKFSEIIDQAQSKGPQIVTKNGRITVVIVSVKEWTHKSKQFGSLAEFFARSPLRNAPLKITRAKNISRKKALIERKSARQLARLGDSEPKLKASRRRQVKVVISPRPLSWEEYLSNGPIAPDDFMVGIKDLPPQQRDF